MSRQSSRTGASKWKATRADRKLQKAKYKLAAVDGMRQRPPPDRAGSVRDNVSIYTTGSTVMRELYNPPIGYDTLTMQRFRDYLEETELVESFRRLMTLLLDRPELPYNPYPGLVQRFRQNAEAFHLDQIPEGKIHQILHNNLQESIMQDLFFVRGYDNIWGLSSILRVISPQQISRYKWLVDNMTPEPENLFSEPGYTNQVTVAMVGPCVFEGTFYQQVSNLQLRKEFLITGEDVKMGVSIFVNSVMAEIDGMYTNPRHLILGVNLPYGDNDSPTVTLMDFWDPDRIQQEKETFLQAMSDTVLSNKYIYMDGIFRVDPDVATYTRGQVQFGLNFISLSLTAGANEGLSSFCEYPMSSLHEGVFLNRSHAEAYLSIFSPQVDHFKQAETRAPVPHATAGKRRTTPGGHSIRSGRATAQSQTNRPFTGNQEQDVRTVRRHIHDRLSQLNPQKIRIDGFKLGDETTYGPFAWQITAPLKSYLQQKLAGHHMHAELFDSCYCVIILLLLERDSFERGLEVEIFRLLHGTAGRIYYLMEQNKSLRFFLKGFGSTKETSVLKEQMAKYREAVVHLLDSDLNVRSADQITVGKIILSQIDDLMPGSVIPFGSGHHIQTSMKTLKNLNWYCLTLLIQVVEDSLPRAPIFKEFVLKMQVTFPERAPRPITRHRQRSDPVGSDMETQVDHGMENDHIKNHERYVIDVQSCMNKDTSTSKQIAREAVLLRYLVDTHVDLVWHDFLLDIATGEHFPPNPYPLLVSILCQCAMRMDLCFERSDTITQRMWSAENMQLEDPDNHVYHIPGVDGHGTPSALAVLDTGAYVPLTETLKVFEQQSYIQRKGAYRVAICMAMCGPGILYGKMQPYLNEIELHEHIYIQGPPGCQGEAIQLFALIVYNHLSDLIKKEEIPVMGAYFGDGQTRWTWAEIMTKKNGFISECVAICSSKETVFMKAYVFLDLWRYVPVRKYFLFHFLTDDDVEAEVFYPDNPVAFYQSIFLSQDRAAFHYQNGGPKNGGSPMNGANTRTAHQFLNRMLGDAKLHCDWLTVHRGLLLRSLLNQDQYHIAEAWRMLHSMAAQIEYVIFMVETLQDLIQLMMEFIGHNQERFRNRRPPPPSQQPSRASKGTKRSKRSQVTPATAASLSSTAEIEGPINEAQLGRMTMIFQQKLVDVCKARISMAGSELANFLDAKLKTALEEDPYIDNFYLAYEDQTLFRLEEIKHMLRLLQDSIANDVHEASPIAKEVMEKIELPDLEELRPSSVASMTLNDPNMYRRTLVPQSMNTILE
ncbi:uncharacterized protein LOC110463111 isoform X3 [Mizuhopecten yessoensis]|uniref:Uncharacterized protein n=1 Tax=Mizuhopecten yessoensis TaxID=6573 RepID=A0A210PWT5_MIZYE|nr:uncharacterized protein LOC110463111 isoform X3 [Mizuhopecten yessoensis]OWF40958.1 hypothetical protein KP79_PYT15985 [Mizuhopecten yessoensis]